MKLSKSTIARFFKRAFKSTFFYTFTPFFCMFICSVAIMFLNHQFQIKKSEDNMARQLELLQTNYNEKITGILNGTTNYILTKMFKEGMDFSEVLKEAQAKGYAEKDPTADVEGIDACRKISILASLVFGKHVNSDKIKTIGISGITADDVAYAEKMNSANVDLPYLFPFLLGLFYY